MEEALGELHGRIIAGIYPSLWAKSVTSTRTSHLITKLTHAWNGAAAGEGGSEGGHALVAAAPAEGRVHRQLRSAAEQLALPPNFNAATRILDR